MSVLTLPSETPSVVGDLLVAGALEVEQHQRHALVIGQAADGLLERRRQIGAFELLDDRQHLGGETVGVIGAPFLGQLAEEAPARAVARQMVQAHVARRRSQPAGGGGARDDFVVVLERPQEHGLGRVLGVGGAAEQAHRRGEHHVLVPPHERLELVWGVHWRGKPGSGGKVSPGEAARGARGDRASGAGPGAGTAVR